MAVVSQSPKVCESMTGAIERRRMPRAGVSTEENIRLELRHRVRLLDISLSGTLIACEASLPVGTRAHFRTGLSGLSFSAEIVVKRHQVKSVSRPHAAVGAQFASIDERNRKHLEQFLERGRNGGS
jgi:c-di-GMP-binding flagellar brake protein YcgR